MDTLQWSDGWLGCCCDPVPAEPAFQFQFKPKKLDFRNISGAFCLNNSKVIDEVNSGHLPCGVRFSKLERS
jgi:hypothetical protein